MTKRTENLTLIHKDRTLIVGVDIAQNAHWARILDGKTSIETGTAFKFKNNIEGFVRLLDKANQAKERTGAEKIVIAMEPSGHYWKTLAAYLLASEVTVVLVNPFHVKKQKELDDNSPSKSDRKDALIIAMLAWQGRFSRCYIPEGVWAELRGYTVVRCQQKRKLNAARNNLVAILDEYFPEYYGVFKEPLGKASLHVLTHFPFPMDIARLTEAELAQELKKATQNRVGEKRATLLFSKARMSVGVKEGLAAARLRLSHCLSEISFYREQLAQTEAAMEDALGRTGIADILLSIRGIGVVTLASLLGEIGDPNRFENWRQVRKLSGYNLVENSSGKHKGKTGISKRGRPRLRSILYQASLHLVIHNPEFRALHEYFKTRRENPLKPKQSLTAISCKLLRVLFVLAKKRCPYDPEKVLGAYRQQQLKLAA